MRLIGLSSILAITLSAATDLPHRAVLQQYCAGCHNDGKAAAGINLNNPDLRRVPKNAAMWEKVVRKLNAGTMPPQGMPRPDRSALDRLARYIETTIDAAAVKPDPGQAILHRLNRVEYGTAVHDLLDLDVDVASLLPADDANFGFDNNADSLRVSPSLLEGYLQTSRNQPAGRGRSRRYAGLRNLSRQAGPRPGRPYRRSAAGHARRTAGSAHFPA
jgi:hypothetical protein